MNVIVPTVRSAEVKIPEDIIEEIVGDISDEFDDDDEAFTKINDDNFLFEGKTLLNDFYKILEVDSDIFDKVKGDADTLAGLILEIKGEFPYGELMGLVCCCWPIIDSF